MKKIIFLLIILLPTFVQAKPAPQEKELETRYRFYYLEKEYSPTFYKESEKPKEYPYQSDLFYYGRDLVKSDTKPLHEEDIVEEKVITKYQRSKPIRYVVLERISSDYAMNLQEIEVWHQGKKIEYKVDCTNCGSEFYAKVQNTIINYEINYIDKNVTITLDLKELYHPEELTLKIHMESSYQKKLTFRLWANSTNDRLDEYYAQNREEELTYYKEISIPLKEVPHEERYEEEVLETDAKTPPIGKVVEQKTYYFYPERYYLYYREKKKYLDGYYKDIQGLEKDLTDFQTIEVDPDISIVEVPVEVEKEVEVVQKEEVPVVETEVVEVEKRVEVPKETIKEITKEAKPNYFLSYIGYLLFGIVLKKMSYF